MEPKVEKYFKDKEARIKEERNKVIDFVIFLMEKYDLKGIDPQELVEWLNEILR